jgi:hypothetical protein
MQSLQKSLALATFTDQALNARRQIEKFRA